MDPKTFMVWYFSLSADAQKAVQTLCRLLMRNAGKTWDEACSIAYSIMNPP